MWVGTIRHHHGWDIGQVGVRQAIGIDIVVLRWDVWILRVVSRHGVTAAEATGQQRNVDGGDKIVAAAGLMSSVPRVVPGSSRDARTIASGLQEGPAHGRQAREVVSLARPCLNSSPTDGRRQGRI